MNTADRSIALLDAALRRRFGFIELVPDAGGQDHADMLVARAELHVLADFIARAVRHGHACQHQIGIHVLQAQQCGVAVADRDYLEALLGEYLLAHALRVGAVVGEQNARH